MGFHGTGAGEFPQTRAGELGLIFGSYFQDLLPCDHFEWLDVYIKSIEKAGTSLVPNLPPAVEQLGSAMGVATVQNGVQNADGLAEVKAELKKMNKQLKKLFDLKKQDNLMAAIFYLCAICFWSCLCADH